MGARLAWAQVDQGSRATQALYTAWESNVTHLATLTSHRPTLHALLAQGNQAKVIAGVALDDDFVIQSREQTGLEHTFILRQPLHLW